jgi:hypothetical protein
VLHSCVQALQSSIHPLPCWITLIVLGFRRSSGIYIYIYIYTTFLSLPNKALTIRLAAGLENREYGSRDPSRWPCDTLYPQKLTLTSPTSCDRSVGIVRSPTKATELLLLLLLLLLSDLLWGMLFFFSMDGGSPFSSWGFLAYWYSPFCATKGYDS